MFELVPTKLQRQSRLVNTLSSASRFASSRTEPPQPRFSASRSRSTSFWPFVRMTLDELKLLPKLDEMVVEMLEHLYFQGYGHGAGDYLMAAVKFVGWIQSFSDLPRAVRTLTGYRRLAPGVSRGPLPCVAAAAMMGVAMATKDEEFAVMLVVQYVAYFRPSELCNRTAGQVIRPLQGSGASRPRQSLGEVHSKQNVCDTSLEPNSDKKRLGFCQIGRSGWSKRDHNSSLLGPSRRSAVRRVLANPIVAGNSETRQMAQREKCQEVRKTCSVAQGDLEAVGHQTKVWTTGDKPPPPPVLARPVLNRAWFRNLVVAPSCTVFSNMHNVKAEMVGCSCFWAGLISLSVAKLHGCFHWEW